MSKKTPIYFNELPDINKRSCSLDYQNEIIFILHYLLDTGRATQAGRYVYGKTTKPLFRHNNLAYQDQKTVESIDKGRGAKLLKFPPDYLEDHIASRKLMKWIVQEFVIIKESASKEYKKVFGLEILDDEKHLVHIIAGAAHHFASTDKAKIPLTCSNDKIHKLFTLSLIGFGLFFYLALVYFYYNHQTIIHSIFAGFSTLITIITLLTLIFLQTKFRLKPTHLRYGLANISLSLSIAIHQLFIFFNMLPPHQRHEMPFAIFGASFILLPVFLLTVFVSLYLLAFLFVQTKEAPYFHSLYQFLIPYVDKVTDKYIALIIFVGFALLAGANLPFLFKQLFKF